MRWRALPLLAALLLLQPASGAAAPVRRPVAAELMECGFYNEQLFRSAIAAAQPYEIPPPLIGIVPHHDVAGVLAASLLVTAAGREIDTVVLIGPNHGGQGAAMATTRKAVSTPQGRLLCDVDAVERLLALPGLTVADELLRRDHSVQALLPLVAHTFPKAEIVTLLLSRTAEPGALSALAAELAALTREKSCLILGSIDFSHGLQPADAAVRDAETAALIAAGDVAALAALGNEHLDAPAVLSTLLQLAGRCDRQLTLLQRADAAEFVAPPWPDGVTGYMIYGG